MSEKMKRGKRENKRQREVFGIRKWGSGAREEAVCMNMKSQSRSHANLKYFKFLFF